MAIASLYGAGLGALHAVTGPDHVLSLGPLALRHPRASFRIGLFWAAGHTLGTLLLALPLLLLSQLVHLPLLAAWSERAAGLALTSAIAKLGARLESRVIAQFQAVFLAAALLLGAYWVVMGQPTT